LAGDGWCAPETTSLTADTVAPDSAVSLTTGVPTCCSCVCVCVCVCLCIYAFVCAGIHVYVFHDRHQSAYAYAPMHARESSTSNISHAVVCQALRIHTSHAHIHTHEQLATYHFESVAHIGGSHGIRRLVGPLYALFSSSVGSHT
jgi:hypothetical protein